jgi:tetratricopeptide (TPR) repeat protein
VSIARGDAARGTAELARLRALEGNSFRARVCAVSLYRLQGRLDEALKAAANLFAESGQQTTAHLIRGYIWLDLGENEKAVGDLQLVVAQQPLNTQAHFKLSEALRALGQPAEALAHSKIANALWAKRMLINSLLKQRAADPGNDALVADQLARLFEEVGDENSAAHWKREAAAAAQKRVRPDR